jgi:hypothetical protein
MGLRGRVVRRARAVLLRLLRPVVAGVEGQLQRLYDRQAEDRARLAELERQLAELRRADRAA